MPPRASNVVAVRPFARCATISFGQHLSVAAGRAMPVAIFGRDYRLDSGAACRI